MVQNSRIQCYNCKEYGHVARECQKPKRAKDAAYHREKMLLYKQEEARIQLNLNKLIGEMILTMNLMIKNWKHITCTWLNFNRFLQMMLTLDLSLTKSQNKSEQIEQHDEDVDLAKESELLASLIAKLKCEIDESKNRNTLLETS
nr:retrovirus-related Pol polyprotein from transposon TNT 1-94 [Tanacetum cinerariifolium]